VLFLCPQATLQEREELIGGLKRHFGTGLDVLCMTDESAGFQISLGIDSQYKCPFHRPVG
jgi:hypothetical protein